MRLVERYSKEASEACQNLSTIAQAEGLEARGEALDFAGDSLKSESALLKARELFASAKDKNGEARALLMLTYTLFSGHKQVEGLESEARALDLWSAAGQAYGVARVHSVLGFFASSKGEFETAHCNYRLAKPVFHELGNRG